MTNEEMEKQFDDLFNDKLYHYCWEMECERRDCKDCIVYQDALEDYNNEHKDKN